MKTISLRQWSTPLIIGSGLFVAVSGVLMFLGIHNPVQEAHEWIGLVFAASIGLHVVNHWRGFRNYFSQPLALGIVAAVALATGAFLLASATEQGGGHGGIQTVLHSIERAPLAELAPLLDQSKDQLIARVQAAGFRVAGADASIEEIASVNGADPKAVVKLLFN